MRCISLFLKDNMKIILTIILTSFILFLLSCFIPRVIMIPPKQTINLIDVGWRIVTAYSSTFDQTDNTPFITAANTKVREGIIACPRYYPFGTKFLINDQMYICEDRLNIRYHHRFDIWFPTTEEAKQWGKQIVFIKLVQS